MTLTSDHAELEETDVLSLERRHQARVAQLRPVRLFESYAGRFFAGVTVNVSVDGMCVRLPASIDLRPGRFVTLHGVASGMRLASGVAHAMTARVVWTAADPEDAESVCVGLQLYAAAIATAA